MSTCKKCRSRKCRCKKKRRKRRCKKGPCCKRNFVTRTTKCKGGCIPDTAAVLGSVCTPGSVVRQGKCGQLVGCGTVNVGAAGPGCGLQCGATTCGLGTTDVCGLDRTFCHLTSGAHPGSTESHLHKDRCGNIFCHSHSGGDISHHHDSDCQDAYLGRVSDCRTLTRDVDCLNRDVLGATLTACGTDADCGVGSTCVAGRCTTPVSTTSLSCDPGFGAGCNATQVSSLSACGRIGDVRPYNGNLVGGFRDGAECTGLGCNNCRLTSCSLCTGDRLTTCNLSCAAPATRCTLPAQSLNARQKTPDLRGLNNDGLSCITGSLCGSKRPTVCKTKIKEVFCC